MDTLPRPEVDREEFGDPRHWANPFPCPHSPEQLHLWVGMGRVGPPPWKTKQAIVVPGISRLSKPPDSVPLAQAILTTALAGGYYCPHLTDEEAEGQGELTGQ